MTDLRLVVSDTGPLITLEKLRAGFSFIRGLYDRILVPPSVLDEWAFPEPARAYLDRFAVHDLLELRSPKLSLHLPHRGRLHSGEQDAIRLALELDLPLLIEETIGRLAAEELGLAISGIAGQVLRAHRLDLITLSKGEGLLQELLDSGRINRRIFDTLRAKLTEKNK